MLGTKLKIDYPRMLQAFVDELLQIMAQPQDLEKVAITQQHKDAQAALEKWLTDNGATGEHHSSFEKIFGKALPPQWPKTPDVLILDKSNKTLFVGEAKNAEVETDKNSATVSRVRFYLMLMEILLSSGLIDMAHFSLVTDRREEAVSWQSTLNLLSAQVGLQSTTGGPAAFRLEEVPGQGLWIATI